MQQLKNGTTLQSGKYKIISMLGRGGFGITYLAEQTMLDGKVAIKEFFFKEYCNRDEETSHVTIPTDGNREIVERFKAKFIKEARTIFKLNHPNIVRIFDIFEENGTAYYVMDYIEGESLNEMVKRRGAIPDAEAIGYIKEVGSALTYIHGKNINHLDIKPGNLMKRRDNSKIQVIDFGVAKQYDAATSEGTTTTPVGISHGYSPSEQYQQNGVQTFSPQSDVYALAATLFKLLTGNTPPEAIVLQDEGLPKEELRMKGVSETVVSAIEAAMQTRTKRTQSVAEFIKNLEANDDEATELTEETRKAEEEKRREEAEAKRRAEEKAAAERKAREEAESEREEENKARRAKPKKIILWAVVAVVAIALAVVGVGVLMNIPPSPTLGTSSYTPNIQEFTVNGVSFQMVEVRGGTFTMGATSEQDATDWEKPAHKVTLSDYYIGKTEVTQALWEAVMGETGKTVSQIASEIGFLTCGVGDNYPMYYISWNDCKEFISKLNALTGKNFRMPTEAEWEYAARGGSKSRGYKYSGSNRLGDVAWYYDNSDLKTHEVGTKSPNELGLYDMNGNVWEWCSDWYGDYSSASQTNPKGPDSGTNRVYRGGSLCDDASICRCSGHRSDSDPGNRFSTLGLRLCLFE